MSYNTGDVWGRREQGSIKTPKTCPDYHVIDQLKVGAGTSQVHSLTGMRCINLNDVGRPNPDYAEPNFSIGQNQLGSSGNAEICPGGSYLAHATIQHDNITGGSANVQQLVVDCENKSGLRTASYQAGKNTGKNTTPVRCAPGSFFNKVLYSEGNSNITGIGFDCYDGSEIVNDDGWRKMNCCRTKTGKTNECGQYFSGPGGACDEYAREFCTTGNNWMMPACVRWAERHATDMDAFYTSRCKSLTTPSDPITSGNFISLKSEPDGPAGMGKYIAVESNKPVLSDIPYQFRIMDTGLRYEGEPIYEFTTIEDLPRYLQLSEYIDEHANANKSIQVVDRNLKNRYDEFATGNRFQFMIRRVGDSPSDDDSAGLYWIEKFGVRISSTTGVEFYPVYVSFKGNKVVLSQTPTFIEIANSDRARTVCSCINAVDDLPELLVKDIDSVGAHAYCFSQDCITGSGYRTEGQQDPCNQKLTICYANVDIKAWESGGVNMGDIIITQNCDDGPSLDDPPNQTTRLLMVFAALIILILLLK